MFLGAGTIVEIQQPHTAQIDSVRRATPEIHHPELKSSHNSHFRFINGIARHVTNSGNESST